eukprot:COSAG02_NODE_3761_length_6272_cov_5.833468_2_plen_42_part_00
MEWVGGVAYAVLVALLAFLSAYICAEEFGRLPARTAAERPL